MANVYESIFNNILTLTCCSRSMDDLRGSGTRGKFYSIRQQANTSLPGATEFLPCDQSFVFVAALSNTLPLPCWC